MSLNRTYNLDWCNSVFEYVSPLVYIDKRGIVAIVTTGFPHGVVSSFNKRVVVCYRIQGSTPS